MSSTPTPPQTRSAYISEAKIHPRSVSGKYQRLRHAAAFWLLGMYYVFPWLHWDNRQAVLFDLPARKFFIFGLTFWPQDFLYLALLLIIAALSLFFFTALAGRLWCGYACPQTVWTEAFLIMERWAEGSRNERIRLDAAPWNRQKLLRKGFKHLLWAVFALWTGFTFVGFFTPIVPLATSVASFSVGGWELFWILFYSVATWGNAGFLREQVCKYMCPYARFQSAMFDRNTLIISYDPMRGEPRGARRRGLDSVLARTRGLLDRITAYDYVFRADAARGTITFEDKPVEPLPKFTPAQLGDCVDCTICVQVCPTGIDIRNGLQYECIACGACIDGCDEVMDKLGYPRGLIRYSTQNAIDGRSTHVVRPRLIVYGVLLAAVIGAWGWGIMHRSTYIAEALRDRNALYWINDAGNVENGYTLKIVNKTEVPARYEIAIAQGPAGARLLTTENPVAAAAGAVLSIPIRVQVPAGAHGRAELTFVVRSLDEAKQRDVKSSFFAPTS